MRVGSNPNNHKVLHFNATSHRVIIPVYIPNAEGYFKDSFNVLKVCLTSLLATLNKDTVVSIVSNGSSDEVNDYIKGLLFEGKIDRAVFNQENIGKMNAVLSETRASFEEFITFSDADVFFDKGWLKETYTLFKAFPKAGFVSMNPMPGSYGFSSSAIIDTLFSIRRNLVKVSDVSDYSDLEHFHKSIGRDLTATEKLFSSKALLLRKGETSCFVGAGHFCCTIRKSTILKYIPEKKATTSGAEAVSVYLDIPSEQSGYWRLSSVKAFVWHMGNVLEPDWTKTRLDGLSGFAETDFSFASCNSSFSGVFFSKYIPYPLKIRVRGLLKKLMLLN